MNIEALLIAYGLVLIAIIISFSNQLKLETDLVIGSARAMVQLIIMGFIFLAAGVLMITGDPESRVPLKKFVADPAAFGQYLFQTHWLAIEIVSLLLLIALIGVLYLGKDTKKKDC